jgi:hypothetical protein
MSEPNESWVDLGDEPAAPSSPRWVFASGEHADVFHEHADGRLLLKHAGALAWSRRNPASAPK